MSMVIRTVRNRLAMLVAAAVTFACLPLAQVEAQFRGGWRDISTPSITSEGLEEYAEMLSMDELQLEFAKDLQQSYLAELAEIGDQMNEVREAAREEFQTTRDSSVWQDMMEVAFRLGEKKEELEEQFFEDVKLGLTDEQLARWPMVEQRFRRDATLSNGGLIAGETVDVFDLAEDSDFAENSEVMAAVTPILERYSEDLDRALVKRNEVYEKGMMEGMRAWRDQDMEKVGELFDNSRNAAKDIRGINERYVRSIASVLPAEDSEAFKRKFQTESFPEIYRDTAAHSAFQRVMELDSLTDEQKKELESIKSAFDERMERINDELADAVLKWEENRPASAMFGRGPRGGSEEVQTERKTKSAFVERSIDQVRGVLTEDQASVLPEAPSKDWRNIGA
ncbi:MAG: hypothetical protein AAGB34_09965 [Planctomycetota bacterium]